MNKPNGPFDFNRERVHPLKIAPSLYVTNTLKKNNNNVI